VNKAEKPKTHITVNVKVSHYESLEEVRLDAENDLGITIYMTDAVKLACTSYFELKELKARMKQEAKAQS